MSRSEKRLAIGLAVVLGSAFIFTVAGPALLGPVKQAGDNLKVAEEALQNRKLEVAGAESRIKTMLDYQERSLSSNVSEASLGYEQWLSDLAQTVSRFRTPKVSRESTSPSRDNSYVAIKIRVSGQGTMSQLREFLYRFHRANVLHQISSLTARATDSSSNPLLDIVILADGLSLRDAPVKGSTLFARSEVVSVDDDPDRRLTVADGTANWPEQTPFEVRVGDQYLTVLERVCQVWEVEGSGVPTAAGQPVTLVPAREATAETSEKPEEPGAELMATTLFSDWDGKSNSIQLALMQKEIPGEDTNSNGQLDEGEDTNGNGKLDEGSRENLNLQPGRMKIRIGDSDSLLSVVACREVWRIADQKFRAPAGTIVESSPVRPEYADVTVDEYEILTDLNPFALKKTLPPDFLLVGDRRVERGESVIMTPIVRNLGPNAATPVFEILSELPDGMSFSDGKLNWTPPDEMEAGKFQVRIRASADALESPLEQSFEVSLTVTKENEPPVLWPPEDTPAAVLGQSLSFKVTATDNETPAEELRFSAGDDFPEGASINAETGEVTWLPPDATQPGSIEFPISVVDNGDPQQTTSVTITVTVEDDRAMFTYLTASIAADAQRQAWFYDRSVNKRVIVQEGDSFSFAGFEALILNIERDFVLMQQERDTLRLEIGSSLRQATVIATAEPAEENPDGQPGDSAATTGDAASAGDPDAANAADLDALLKGLDEQDSESDDKTSEAPGEETGERSPPPVPESKSEPAGTEPGRTEQPAAEQPAAEDAE